MARTAKDTVDYFPHFVEHGKTLYILKSRFGNNGYAFWFQMLEVLCAEEGHYYDCRGEDEWQYLVARLGVDEISATEILNLVAKMGKIDPEMWENRIIWCGNLIKNLTEVYKKRGRMPKKPLHLLNNKTITVTEKGIPAPEKGITDAEMPQSKVNKSKVNKSREDDDPLPPTPPAENLSSSSSENQEDDLNIYQLYENEIGELTPGLSEILKDAETQYPSEWISGAIKLAATQNKRNWSYVKGILENCRAEQHAPGNGGKAPPGKNNDPDRYVKGKYSHVVKR